MPVDAGAAYVDDAPHTSPVGFVEQRLGGVDVDGPELPVIDLADMRCVQRGGVDQKV